MKKITVLLFFCLLIVPAKAQTTITPQLGVNGSYLTNEYTGVTFSSQVGYQFGVNIRFGGFFHIQPGIYFESLQKEVLLEISGLDGDFKLNYLNIPVLAGIKIIPLKVFDMRLNTGISFSLLTSVGANPLGLDTDDFASTHWGWIIGAGFDFLFLSTDISYEFGLSNAVEAPIEELDEVFSSKNNIFRLNVGVRL